MICKKCGKSIEGNRVYCQSCGTEVQIVPEYNKVEEELNESIRFLPKEKIDNQKEVKNDDTVELKEKQQASNRPMRNRDAVFGQDNSNMKQLDEEEGEWEEYRLDKKPDTEKEKRMKLIAAIIGLSMAILAAIICIVVFFVIKGRNYSFDVQYDAAAAYLNEGNYDKAIVAYEKAINAAKNDSNRITASKELAKLFKERGDKNNAIYYLESVIDIDSTDVNSVKMLIELYEEKNNSDAIRRLAQKASNDKTVSLFEKYLLNQPVFNYKSGTYNELLTVEITTEDEEMIYYTLDDTTATVESIPYTDPIAVGEGTSIIHAITVNRNGFISEEIVVTYAVMLDVPPNPIITPDTGVYSDATKISIANIPTNCTVYYTIDGTVPTTESEEYKEPFDMLLGNYVISAISVNQYTKVTSEVVSKVFDLNINGKISWTEANAKVMSKLQQSGEVADANGSLADGGTCVLVTQTTCKIGNSTFYIVRRYKQKGTSISEHDTAYAVDISTGDVFVALPNGAGQYNLSAR